MRHHPMVHRICTRVSQHTHLVVRIAEDRGDTVLAHSGSSAASRRVQSVLIRRLFQNVGGFLCPEILTDIRGWERKARGCTRVEGLQD